MTKQTIESTRDETGAGAEVGYGKPPAAHRFRKGISGNPAGRPRRVATGAPGDRLPGADEPTRAMILEEAYRLVTLRDGAAEIRMPVNQAIFRSMAEAAMQGNPAAQHRWTRLVQTAEAEQKRNQIALCNVIERADPDLDWLGDGAPAERASYTDDVVFDSRSGTVVFRNLKEAGKAEE